MGPLLFLNFINNLAENLSSNPKLFAHDTSLFSVVRDLSTSANEINDGFKKIESWAYYHWKMSFNPDPNPLKQASKSHHFDIIFNCNSAKKALTKNIWECFLIVNLILMNILKVTSKCIGLIRKLRNFLPRSSLL